MISKTIKAITLLCILSIISLCLQEVPQNTDSFDHQHSLWNQTQNKTVTTQGAFSRVNYEKLINDPNSFQSYLTSIEEVSKKTIGI